jgi:type II secretory pathway component PulJ
VALLAVASYIAVSSLVRLMIDRRGSLSAELRAEFEATQKQLEREKQQAAALKQPARGGRPAA